MHAKLKHPLMIAVLLCAVGLLSPAHAQNAQTVNDPAPQAVPAAAPASSLTAIELFSSQACIFCPRADALFAEVVKSPNVIGLSCHVDYFDVRTGSLARPFCTARQSWYMQALGAGPNFTPQMVVNGAYDVVGYKLEALKDVMTRAEKQSPHPINIAATATANDYVLSWPAVSLPADDPAVLWVMTLDRPRELEIAEGRNKGQKMTYVNIVSDLEDRGDWNAAEQRKSVQVLLQPDHDGFVVIAQSRKSGRILAAGQYRKSQ